MMSGCDIHRSRRLLLCLLDSCECACVLANATYGFCDLDPEREIPFESLHNKSYLLAYPRTKSIIR